MNKAAVILVAALAALALGRAAHAEPLPCGLPDARPLWVEFSDRSVQFRLTLFGRPGLVLAANGIDGPAQLRALGAQTVYWHMQFKNIVGTPNVPLDPAVVEPNADALVDKAIASTGCQTPLIALNELFGSRARTPWLPTVAQYRANVLAALRRMAERGAHPFLLVPAATSGPRAPFTGGDAAAWWQSVAEVADIVKEMHFHAPTFAAMTPLIGGRARRMAMRAAIANFTKIGIPAERMGLMLGFQSGLGSGGREGLKPREAWFEIVKREALAARQVASDLGLRTIWSWGWGTFGPESADPDKPAAACVYLWTRAPKLCDGPGMAGPRFNTSRTQGQIILPAGVQCRTSAGRIRTAAVERLSAATSDREAVVTALVLRRVYAGYSGATTSADLLHGEAAIVEAAFGDLGAYQAELDRLGLTRALVRELVGDEFRRQGAEARLAIEYPTINPRTWTRRRLKAIRNSAICLRDELPGPRVVEWRTHVPFLALTEPRVSITAGPTVLARGASTILSGAVVSDRAYEVVNLYARPSGSGAYTRVGTARVGDNGRWSLRVTPRASTTYRALSRSAVSRALVIGVRGGSAQARL